MTTLYEQIGGKENIEQMVTAFYQRVLADPMMQPFFENSSIEKLKKMQVAFFSIALDGPEPDVKISLEDAHRDRGIKIKHLTRFTEHLMSTLVEVGVSEEHASQIYDRIATYSNAILGESSIDG